MIISETPQNIEELKKLARKKTDYKSRLTAVENLGKYKCKKSIDILWSLMMQDKVYIVQETAFRKLQAFGEDVKLPRKKNILVKDIKKKLAQVKRQSSDNAGKTELKENFLLLFPSEYDIYKYEKKDKFGKWLYATIASLPKK